MSSLCDDPLTSHYASCPQLLSKKEKEKLKKEKEKAKKKAQAAAKKGSVAEDAEGGAAKEQPGPTTAEAESANHAEPKDQEGDDEEAEGGGGGAADKKKSELKNSDLKYCALC